MTVGRPSGSIHDCSPLSSQSQTSWKVAADWSSGGSFSELNPWIGRQFVSGRHLGSRHFGYCDARSCGWDERSPPPIPSILGLYQVFSKWFLIHEADQSRQVVVRPSVRASQNFKIERKITTCRDCGLAEWITWFVFNVKHEFTGFSKFLWCPRVNSIFFPTLQIHEKVLRPHQNQLHFTFALIFIGQVSLVWRIEWPTRPHIVLSHGWF